MDIAICVCGRVRGTCSSMGCFNAFNEKSKNFERYKDEETVLHAYFMCNHCIDLSTEYLEKMAEKLKEKNVTAIHFGKCAVNCKAGFTDENKAIFENVGIKVVEGTH